MSIQTILAMLAIGTAAGVLGGLFGIGGGLIIVPALVVFYGIDQKVATGTSLFVILWPTGLFGVIQYWQRKELRVDYGVLITLGLLVGIALGARLAGSISSGQAKRYYGIFLLVVGLYLVLTGGKAPARKAAQDRPPAEGPSAPVDQVH